MESSPPRLGGGAAAADGLSLLTVPEVASILHLSGEAVRLKIKAGVLPAYRLGDGPKARYRVPSAAVAEFMRDAAKPIVETRHGS